MYWKIPIHLQNFPIKSHCFLLSKMESLIMFPSSCSKALAEASVKAVPACIVKRIPKKIGNLRCLTVWFGLVFLMMMWYESINKIWVKAGFCLHCDIPRIVCSPALMQTQTPAPTACENAKELTEKQSGKD